MHRRFLPAVVVAILPMHGCAAVNVTKDAARFVGKSVKEAGQVITWPVREVMKMHKESQTPDAPPLTTVSHGDTEKANHKSSAKAKDHSVLLVGGSERDEQEESPKPRRKRTVARSAVNEEQGDSKSDEPAAARKRAVSSDDDSDLNDEDRPARSPNWKSKKPTRSASSDSDTIRIQ